MTTTLNPKITTAGLAIAPSVQNPGISVTLTHVALGTGRYVPNGSEVALRAEVARYAITSGTNPSPRTVQVGLTITDLDATLRSPNGKGIGEVGFYAGNTLFAVWSQDAEPLFYKSAAFDIPMAYTLDVSSLPNNAVTVTVDVNKAGLDTLILSHEAKADPHPQYLTPAEGNAAYTPLAHAGAADPHTQYVLHTEGDAAYAPKSHVTDVDPHPQYLTPAEGNAAYAPLSHVGAADPHAQYVLHTEGDAAYAPKSHTTDVDPHPQYLTTAEGNAAYAPLSHVGAADPHAQYVLHTEGDAAYAPKSHTTDVDPHPQYLTPAEGNAAYAPLSHVGAADPHAQYVLRTVGDAAYAPIAHVGAADPHTQYVLHTEGDAAYAPKSHVSDIDPHPQYLTPAEGNAAYTPLAHANAANPHPQYMQRADTDTSYVRRGGGIGQLTNAVYMGWSGSNVKVTVDATDMGNVAFQGWVNQLFTDLIGAAPSTLNQINELAAALGSDPNFSVTMANSLAGKERKFDAGVRIAFANWSAPTGWTTVNDDTTNNRMMRVVNSNGSGAGGIHDPTVNNVVAAHTHGFSTGTESADHSHPVSDPGHAHGGGMLIGDLTYYGSGNTYVEEGQGSPNYPRVWPNTAYTGVTVGGISANHTHSGSTDNGSSQTSWQPRYLNIIICQKD